MEAETSEVTTRHCFDWGEGIDLSLKKRLHKRSLVENLQLVNALPDSNVLNRNFELVADADGDATFGCAVEFGEREAGDGRHFGELFGLFLCVLAGGSVKYEQHVVGCAG